VSAALRVLVLNERDPAHPRAGGAEVHLAELAPRLAARGIALTQLACRFRGASRRERVGALEVRRLGGLPGYYPRAALACARATRRGDFDLVLEVLCKLPFYSPLYAAVPVLCVLHHFLGDTAYLQARWPVAAAVVAAECGVARAYRSTRFVAGSESSRQDLLARGIESSRVRVIPYGCGPRAHAVAAPARERHRIAYVGRLEPYKRVDVLLRAAAALAERFPALEVVIAGRGGDQARLERLADELGIRARTRFAGFVSDDERDALYASARAAVQPSQKEGFGLSVIEANAFGTPVVASASPGLRDAVRDGETGFLVEPGNSAAVAERLAALIADDALHARLSEAARRESARFDWDHSAEALAQELRALAPARTHA
jgi:glycosyltransferase involved in cell wall biosynthesis